jgi:hypothetical protein
MTRMLRTDGPMNVMPQLAQISAKAAFSLKKP